MALLAASVLASRWGMGKHIWAASMQKIVEMKRVGFYLRTTHTYTDLFHVALICLDIRLYFRTLHYQNLDLDVLPTDIWNELDDMDMSHSFGTLASWKYDRTPRLPRPDPLFLERVR
jgi:hypothetical protein